jgi:hypothetical protein
MKNFTGCSFTFMRYYYSFFPLSAWVITILRPLLCFLCCVPFVFCIFCVVDTIFTYMFTVHCYEIPHVNNHKNPQNREPHCQRAVHQGIQHRATFQSSDGENVLSAHNAGAHDTTN